MARLKFRPRERRRLVYAGAVPAYAAEPAVQEGTAFESTDGPTFGECPAEEQALPVLAALPDVAHPAEIMPAMEIVHPSEIIPETLLPAQIVHPLKVVRQEEIVRPVETVRLAAIIPALEIVHPSEIIPETLLPAPTAHPLEIVRPGEIVRPVETVRPAAIDPPVETVRRAEPARPAETVRLPELRPKVETSNPKPVSEFALDLVLNEIVLQARLTTNATGAVFAMARSGELVCRATTGATAADVAICLKAKSGIAVTCFATGALRRVDDLEPDPNEDATAYRRNGVRSILVVPVQGEKGPVMGVLEIFSPRPNAFCDRDAITLQALARRISANVELVQQSCKQQNFAYEADVDCKHHGVAAWPLRPMGNSVAPSSQPLRPKLTAPKFINHIVAQGSRLALVDWISVLTRSSVALVLIAGLVFGRSCWIHNGGMQAIRGPLSEDLALGPKAALKTNEPNAKFPAVKVPAADLSAWTSKASSHSLANASITIQRQPLHPSNAAAAIRVTGAVNKQGAPESVAAETHPQEAAKEATPQEGKVASQDPAAGLSPHLTKVAGEPKTEVLSSSAAMARLVQRVEPEYPNAARQQHVSGTVILDVVVDPSGAVDGLSMVSGESQLMVAAAQAVKQWRFQPLMKNGKATKFETRIAIDFTLVVEGH